MATIVLILVVVDNGLVLSQITVGRDGDIRVLILIVVDNGLVLNAELKKLDLPACLNPCCSGQWSSTNET